MQTSFSHLSPVQTALLAKLIQKIVHAINPDKIACYGSRTTTMQDWSPFMDGSSYKETIYPAYDLLVITSNQETRSDHELIQAIEQQTTPLDITVTCVIQSLASFNEALEKGSRFAATVYHKGVLLYNGSGLPLTVPLKEPDGLILKQKVIKHWEQCFPLAQRFFKTASFCFENGWYEQTVFDLHQSVQHTCMALLRTFTGYRSTTHNLTRLFELMDNFSQELIVIFPCITKEETQLFTLLNKAYSEARYNEQYKVPAEQVTILIDRVKQLLEVAQQLYNEKLQALQAHLSLTFPLTRDHE